MTHRRPTYSEFYWDSRRELVEPEVSKNSESVEQAAVDKYGNKFMLM